MSIVCVISNPPSMGLTSTLMLCQLASNSLCPSSRLLIPALPLHGKSFKNGVRFSVQTTSLGNVPWSRCRFCSEASLWLPRGSNDITGRVVRVESMKLREAQKRPESAFVRVSQRPSALSSALVSPVPFKPIPAIKKLTLHRYQPPPKPIALHPCLPLAPLPTAWPPNSRHPTVPG